MNRRGLFGDEHGIAHRQDQDPGAEPDSLSSGGQVAERGEGLEQVPKRLRMTGRDGDVVARLKRGITELFGFGGDGEHRLAVAELAVVGQVQPDDHLRRPRFAGIAASRSASTAETIALAASLRSRSIRAATAAPS